MKKHLFFFLQTATDCEPHLKIKQLTTSWGIKSHLSFIYLELVVWCSQSIVLTQKQQNIIIKKSKNMKKERKCFVCVEIFFTRLFTRDTQVSQTNK